MVEVREEWDGTQISQNFGKVNCNVLGRCLCFYPSNRLINGIVSLHSISPKSPTFSISLPSEGGGHCAETGACAISQGDLHKPGGTMNKKFSRANAFYFKYH